ncbi:Coiled-coil domain-containing [Hyphodiscus hymeniophilus]|uniref:Coiled-coil domain-containing n=1 Tax=Hyphodiscus hymeniophilus TaxID=353542 RepID=A0A9P6VL39_9HELO|nr:Coiled-coil domain-containing [Hyphodiscus hymeniophilus]
MTRTRSRNFSNATTLDPQRLHKAELRYGTSASSSQTLQSATPAQHFCKHLLGMASNASLFPHHNKSKTKPKEKELSSSTSLAFTSTLSSLLSRGSSSSTTKQGRPRPSKTKEDIFTSHNRNTKKRAAKDLEADDDTRYSEQVHQKDIGDVDASVLHRSKRKMEQKAKLYKQMRRGELGGEEETAGGELVDFDRKWAERGEASSSEDDDGMNEIVDYEDEYGRARRGTRREAERMNRRKANAVRGQEELDRMSARPAMPSNIIYGDTVQVAAFNPDEPVMEKMEEIARKRDRSLTPPEQKHYEADKEFRIKGVGFYSFSKDEKIRGQEMEALERERLETERMRMEREGKKEARKREIEERRKQIGEKRAKKQANSFLTGLEADLGQQDD